MIAKQDKPARPPKASEVDFFHALMDSASDNFYFKDLDSRFVRINKAMAKYFSLKKPEDAVGLNDYDFFTAEHASQAFRDEQEIIRTGKPVLAKEEKETWPDGRITWVSSVKAPLYDKHGRIAGTFGISRDITAAKAREAAEKAFEEKLQQSEKLESLGMLASGIAHDFNNLLLGVLGNSSLLLNRLPADSDAVETVRQIETAATRASDLTAQLLAYAGKGSVTVAAVDLSTLAREMGKLLEILVSRNVTLNMNLESSLPAIDADPTQMRQLIMNLIKNASDAVGDRTASITVTTGTLDRDTMAATATTIGEIPPSGTCVYIEVADTGPGIPEDVQKRIFDPFFTTKSTGRGLGLATVQGIVRGHKGALVLDSVVGRGTAFRAIFKASGKTAVRMAEQGGPQKAHLLQGTGTMLIVDDEPIVRQVASQMAAAMGFKPLAVSSGAEALKAFAQQRDGISVVLLDDVMPQMPGSIVFTELRKLDPNVKVILCSGYTRQDATAKFGYNSLSGFVHKPFTLKSLSDEIEKVCAR